MNLISKIFFDAFRYISFNVRIDDKFLSLNERLSSVFLYLEKKTFFLVDDNSSFQAIPLSEEEAVTLLEKNSSLLEIDEEETKRQAEILESERLLKEAVIAEKKNCAANVIQKSFRRYLNVRQMQKRKHVAAMQHVFQERKERLKEKRAAIVIQRVYRGHRVRCQLKPYFLPFELFEAAKPFIVSGKVTQFSRSSCGKTAVYFHPDLPIVFKESGSPQNIKRWQCMIQAKEICQKNHYSSLVIPEARVHGNFIIERCLPLRDGVEQKKQVGLYVEHQQQFTKAVEEFTSFLCQTTLDDLSGQNNDFWICLCPTRVGRYDNIALYLDDQKEPKIGLIDLETFSSTPSQSPRATYSACLQAIRLFPLHFEHILAVAKRFDPQIEKYEKDLKEERDLLVKYVDMIYQHHRKFADEKGIIPGGDQTICAVDGELDGFVDSMMASWESWSRQLPKIGSYDCLVSLRTCASLTPEQINLFFSSKDPSELFPFIPVADRKEIVLSEDQQKALREQIVPELYKITLQFMNRLLEAKLQAAEGNAPSTYPSLLFMRSLIFDEKSAVYLALQEEFSSKLNEAIPFQNEFQKKYLLDCMVKAVFQELARFGKIAYYNPEFGFRSNPQHCIFC